MLDSRSKKSARATAWPWDNGVAARTRLDDEDRAGGWHNGRCHPDATVERQTWRVIARYAKAEARKGVRVARRGPSWRRPCTGFVDRARRRHRAGARALTGPLSPAVDSCEPFLTNSQVVAHSGGDFGKLISERSKHEPSRRRSFVGHRECLTGTAPAATREAQPGALSVSTAALIWHLWTSRGLYQRSSP